ncbi:guanyl-specific ribonuclease Sa [Luteimonas cucumeris]|uniref:Guanyl-specific ribonuclease Sa n=1 Tax=Luteimonas cucumeris TaxID=985012 RepID=A0A562LAB2_9GAMM|nr:ribonuclease domain-containing protein [Luteimonas cucumeris]TWI04561.1 guanyl-specific ribonuclease Sa [Luteimonas cucumeris]
MRKPLLLVVALLLVAVALLWPRPTTSPDTPTPASITPTSQSAIEDDARRASASGVDTLPALPGFLPREAHDTVRLILQGGPYAHRQDGSVFGNREGRLPRKPRGYYREYTVDTPGLDHRGARRIVTGGDPPEIWYYSDDHYDSFRAFEPGAQGTRR